jgi:hypothetical protein
VILFCLSVEEAWQCAACSSELVNDDVPSCADGNKLFQSEFINVIHPGSNLLGLLEYNLLNSSVALFGYYFAAFTIDRAWMGRRRMQVRGSCCLRTSM